MKKSKHQRQAYALRRTSFAMDRVILALSQDEKKQGAKWAELWALAAGIRGPAGTALKPKYKFPARPRIKTRGLAGYRINWKHADLSLIGHRPTVRGAAAWSDA